MSDLPRWYALEAEQLKAEIERLRAGLQLIANDKHRLMNEVARQTAASILGGKPIGEVAEWPKRDVSHAQSVEEQRFIHGAAADAQQVPEGMALYKGEFVTARMVVERLAEADDKLLSVAIELGTTKARLAEARGCFDAALFEGWLDALANGDIERIRDLWTRRISFAMEAVTADSAPVAFWDCDCGQVNDDPTCIRCGATPTVPVAPEAK